MQDVQLIEIATCVACDGTGASPRGAPCKPCKGSGKNAEALRPALAPYKAAVGDFETQLIQGHSFLGTLRQWQIATEDDYRMAGDGLKHCKAVIAGLEGRRKAITDPLNTAKREVDGWFRDLRTPYEQAETYLKQSILDYQARQMAERARLAEELKASAGNVPQTMALAAQAQQTVPPKLDGIQNRVVKKWRVVNLDLIPRQVMMVDDYKVSQLMHQGVAVPGIEYYEDQIIAARKS